MAKQFMAVDALILAVAGGPTAFRAVLAWAGIETFATAGTGSILLGETMKRVQPVADEIGAGTFNEPWTGDAAQMMTRNMSWLQGQIDAGARIFDVGKDALRAAPSDFYAAETKLLLSNGYTQQFVKFVMVNGEAQKLFEWVKTAP